MQPPRHGYRARHAHHVRFERRPHTHRDPHCLVLRSASCAAESGVSGKALSSRTVARCGFEWHSMPLVPPIGSGHL
eukprot:COSAG05_NODE_310_length_11636_cov_115.006934_13_plen_76_part_00